MSEVVLPLADWLRESVRSGLLFGRLDEPLDDYGKRIVRAILAEIDHASMCVAAIPPAPAQEETPKFLCACVSYDAERCMALRYPAATTDTTDDDEIERCQCSCHDFQGTDE